MNSGDWARTSASQIKTFVSCPRKWWRESVAGERPPPSRAALRGQKIHAELERYLGEGEPVQDGTAHALTHLLPPAGTVSTDQIEVEFLFTPDGWPCPIKGFVDVAFPAHNLIIDHKTTSNLKWALTERAARRDPQVIAYIAAAQAGLLGSFDTGEVEFRLQYATTQGAVKTQIVSISMGPEEIAREIDRLKTIVQSQY